MRSGHRPETIDETPGATTGWWLVATSLGWRFIGIAIGSGAEVDSLLAHAVLVRSAEPGIVRELLAELPIVRKMLFGLRAALQRMRGP